MSTYVVRVDYTHESKIDALRVTADSPIEAALQAGAYAGRQSDGNVDTLRLLSINRITEVLAEEWSI